MAKVTMASFKTAKLDEPAAAPPPAPAPAPAGLVNTTGAGTLEKRSL